MRETKLDDPLRCRRVRRAADLRFGDRDPVRAYEQDGLHALFPVPEGLFEAAFAIYLIVKGFRPSPILDDARFSGGTAAPRALRLPRTSSEGSRVAAVGGPLSRRLRLHAHPHPAASNEQD